MFSYTIINCKQEISTAASLIPQIILIMQHQSSFPPCQEILFVSISTIDKDDDEDEGESVKIE